MIRVVLMFVVVVGCAAAELDADRQAVALALREGYRGVDGGLGELGPWQIREITWRQHMPGVPFSEARKAGPARACALKHIRWLAAQLEARQLEVSPLTVAVAWNAGLERYLSGRAPERAWHFGLDVEALYDGEIGKNTEPKPASTTSRRRVISRVIPTEPRINQGIENVVWRIPATLRDGTR